MARLTLFLLASSAMISGQELPADWEVRDTALSLAGHLETVANALEKLDTAHWDGAPAAYAEQQESALKEAGYAATAARQLASEPKTLSKAFELHLRAQSLEGMATSLALGAKTYQNNESAELMLNALASVAPEQSKLRQYLVDLALWKEKELSTADGEAQRCRAEMLRQPLPVPARRGSSTANPARVPAPKPASGKRP